MIPVETLHEEVSIPETPRKERPQPFYKCNDCSFSATNTDILKDHKKDEHTKEKETSSYPTFLHSCISCDYRSNNYSLLMLHIDDKHRPIPTASLLYKCEECGFTSESINGLLVLKTSTHMRAVKKCNLCEFEAMDSIEMKEHIETSHCSSLTLYMLTTLKELTTVVSKLSEDILQIKSDSIIIYNDMMSVIRGDIVEEVTDHVTSKFDILDRRSYP